jgi:hypothetical protein
LKKNDYYNIAEQFIAFVIKKSFPTSQQETSKSPTKDQNKY